VSKELYLLLFCNGGFTLLRNIDQLLRLVFLRKIVIELQQFLPGGPCSIYVAFHLHPSDDF